MAAAEDRASAWERMLSRIADIPALPTTMAQLVATLGDERTSAADVSKIIATDQSLATRLLRVANSPFYGLSRQVATLQQAVAVLGFDDVRAMVFVASTGRFFPEVSPSKVFNRARFWQHSLAVANCAKAFGRETRIAPPDEAFMGGLLHDVGKVVFDQYAHQQFIDAVTTAREEGISLYDAEQLEFGLCHTRIGRWVLTKWGLPPSIVAAVNRHHDPIDTAAHFPLIALVHLANAYCKQHQWGDSGDDVAPQPQQCVLDAVRLSPQALGKIDTEVEKALDNAAALLGLG